MACGCASVRAVSLCFFEEGVRCDSGVFIHPVFVVGCKIPWKDNSLISRGIGDFFIYPARACLFWGKPGKKFQSTHFLYPERLFYQSSGQPRVTPGETGRGGSAKKNKNRRVFFSRYLAVNDGAAGGAGGCVSQYRVCMSEG